MFCAELFVSGDVLVSVQPFRIFLCFQHASTICYMVFKANCDVHFFHCCLILFERWFSSWQSESSSFLSPLWPSLPLLSPTPPLSPALREPTVLTIFRRLVDAWLQCCVVSFFHFLLHSVEEKLIFLECLLLSMSVRHFSTILVASLFLILIIRHFFMWQPRALQCMPVWGVPLLHIVIWNFIHVIIILDMYLLNIWIPEKNVLLFFLFYIYILKNSWG